MRWRGDASNRPPIVHFSAPSSGRRCKTPTGVGRALRWLHNREMLLNFSRLRERVNVGLLVTVVFPTACALLYYTVFASDVYTSESRFVVRSPEQPARTTIGNLLQGTGFNKTADDSFTVREYVLSRDALRVLDDTLGLRAAYGSKNVDIFSRFGGLDFDRSFEALHHYYQSKVDVQTDANSSIVTLSVKAFTAQDAANANRILLEQSEKLVNRLNERGRQDLIRYARDEVTQAEKAAKTAALALSDYRNAQNVVDPERQATLQLQQVAKLQDELIATNNQLSQLQSFTPANPQIPALRNRSRTLQVEMQNQSARVAGGSSSLANKAAGIQRLSLESEFANKQLASAMASLETARNEAQRQQVYLERIAQPSVPDVAQEPRRLKAILSIFILGLVAWGLSNMLLAGLREHTD
jgi:capsular polysaccharide transport system permease protein